MSGIVFYIITIALTVKLLQKQTIPETKQLILYRGKCLMEQQYIKASEIDSLIKSIEAGKPDKSILKMYDFKKRTKLRITDNGRLKVKTKWDINRKGGKGE